MNKHLGKLLILFVSLLAGLSAGAQEVVLHETFNHIEGRGGNDKQWSGTGVGTTSLKTMDLPGWTFNRVYRAKACVKLGTANEAAALTTPALERLNGAATVTLRVGGWADPAEVAQLQLSMEGGGTLSPMQHRFTAGAFTEVTATIAGGTPESRLTIASQQAKQNRFFLDEVRIESSEPYVEPHPLVVVNNLSELAALPTNTLVRLTFSKDNMGKVQADRGEQEVYVSDSTHSVVFSRFLLDNRGWHPTVGGKLAGVVEGLYVVRAGLPTLQPTPASSARGILCLPYEAAPQPRFVTTKQLGETALRASLVGLVGSLHREGDQLLMNDGQGQVRLVDRFHRLPEGNEGPDPHQSFRLMAIVGTDVQLGGAVLFPLHLEALTSDLVLDAQQDNQLVLGTWKGRRANVQIHCHLAANAWNTLVLPFAVESLDETTLSDLLVAQLERYDESTQTLHFKTVQSIEAGVPYLVKPAREILSIEGREVTLNDQLQASQPEGVRFLPAFAPLRYTADAPFFLISGDHPFTAPSEAGILPAFQAHLVWPNEVPKDLRFAIDGKVTHVTSLASPTTDVDDDSITHSLTGRRVNRQQPLTPGVYLTRQQRLILK